MSRPRATPKNWVHLEEVLANSFFDYHVKGFDYVCLKRSFEHTIKLYFFDGDVSKMPEVVAPHDHRYDFDTRCLAGSVENRIYRPVSDGAPGAKRYEWFFYTTPLNGGSGFKWRGERFLAEDTHRRIVAKAGEYYPMWYEEIHTIQLRENSTVLRLDQYQDVVPMGVPTSTYTTNREPPSLSGLYRKPKADEVMARLNRLSPSLDLPRIV